MLDCLAPYQPDYFTLMGLTNKNMKVLDEEYPLIALELKGIKTGYYKDMYTIQVNIN